MVTQAAVRAGNWGLYFKYRDAIDPVVASWTGNSAIKTILTKGAAPDFQVPFTMAIAGGVTGATFSVIAGQLIARVVLHIRTLTSD